jgi:metal-dependent amidase/aminoacylase/carboxypeptidase family protein
VRSSDDKYLPTLLEMVKNSAQGAAIATGCGVSFIESEGLKSNLRNCGLENLFQRIFQELNWSCEDPTETALRPPSDSTDFADVSHVVAGIHPMIGIHTADIPMHSREFAGVTFTPEGDKGLEIGAKAMAMVTVELMASPYLVKEIRREFESKCQ